MMLLNKFEAVQAVWNNCLSGQEALNKKFFLIRVFFFNEQALCISAQMNLSGKCPCASLWKFQISMTM